MRETSLKRERPRSRQRRSPAASLKTPLIPLQEQVQPLIPLQVSSPRAKLQHELSHAKPTSPHQTGAAAPMATKMAARSLQKRQQEVTKTVTDASVVIINASGQTIAATALTSIPTGSITMTLPFTTVVIPPLTGITGVLTMTSMSSPSVLASSAASVPSSGIVTQNSEIQGSAITLAPTTVSTLEASTQTPLAQTGGPLASASANTTSISTTTSLTVSPSTIATIVASQLISGSSTSSPTSTFSSSSSILTSSSSTTVASSSTTGPPSVTSGMPAAATTTGAASAGGSTVNVPVVAGVVGGLGGLAVVLGLLLLLLRWLRKRQSGSTMLRSMDDEGTAPGTSHSNAPMTQNFASMGPGGAGVGAGAAAAGAAGGVGIGAMIKRMTGGSTATTDTAPSERGFQNLGGRKLESVLISGGDGFGEPGTSGDQANSFSRGWAERFPYDTPSRHSSMIVGPATPFRRPSSSVAELSASRPDSDTIRIMGSPPRNAMPGPSWPLTNTSAGRPVRSPEMSESSSPPQLFRGVPSLDPLGRTRYSQDGSRNSRFTEGL